MAALFVSALGGILPAAACPIPHDVVVTQSAWIDQDGHRLEVVAASLTTLNDDGSRLVVFDDQCHVLLNEKANGLESRFEIDKLGQAPILQFVTMQMAGDGTNYVHRLFLLHNGRVQGPIQTIETTGKDGFYLGPFITAPGAGIVVWAADPGAESEAEAHPYIVSRWRWNGHRLAPPTRFETRRKYKASDDVVPRANAVAQAMDLPYRDQTGVARFMDIDRLLSIKARMENAGIFSNETW
ncbi:hypothetical protein WJ542_26615 [Paraburkholderia sp. B3]|uniref:hypothetical protein n=1 Tax=Paraburkholderia sp. B3 TaxID=3134791 RepID=UPI003982397A